MLVKTKYTKDPSVVEFAPDRGVAPKVIRLLHRLDKDVQFWRYKPRNLYEMFSLDRTAFQSLILKQLPECDVINLHWVSDFIDASSFLILAVRDRPVVWRLSDMNPFTGGCHYDAGCGRYASGCGFCPQLNHPSRCDLSHKILARKQKAFDQIDSRRMMLVAQSNWMAEKISHSPFLNKFQTVVIPNGVDAEVYSPKDKRLVRSILGLPLDAKIILFSSDYLSHGRKGFQILEEAISILKTDDRPLLITAGKAPPDVAGDVARMHFGHISDMRLLSILYSAADIFVIPSLQDNCPNTVLEAMACGTPVVGFAVSGIPEIVQNGVTGLLASSVSPAALAEMVLTALNDKKLLETMASNSRQRALQNHTYQQQVSLHMKVYSQLLSQTY